MFYPSFILPSIKHEFNEKLNAEIYYIDSIPTILYSVKGDFAKGAIVSDDLSLTPCFVMKKDDIYAHGETLHEVHKIVQDKFDKKISVKERINKFKEHFPDFSVKVLAKELFEWHYYLTGSCKLGKLSVVANKNIDLNHDLVSVNEFIEMSRNKFGWDIISMLI